MAGLQVHRLHLQKTDLYRQLRASKGACMTDEQRAHLLADVPVRSLLLTDWYELDVCDRNYRLGVNSQDTFEAFSRAAPFSGAYMVCAGTIRALTYLLFTLSREEAEWLVSCGLSRQFAEHLLNAGPDIFRGVNVWAVDEGRVVFPNEPMLRVEGPTIPAQMLETYVLNAINYSTLVATKAARMRYAAGESTVLLEFGMRRAQDLAHIVAARCSVIGGLDASSNTYASRVYGLPPRGSVMHAQVQRYDDEMEAFRDLYRSAVDKNRVTLLLDTYDTINGAYHAVQLAREMRVQGHQLYAVRLDSGGLPLLSRQVRAILTEAGFPNVRIILSGDLNEERIQNLLRQGADFDVLGLGTNLVTCQGQPALPGVYKLTAIRNLDTGAWVGRIKTSNDPAKSTNPGSHQVYRFYDEDGMMREDVIALDPEDTEVAALPGAEPLLRQVVRDGRIVLPDMTPSEMLLAAKKRAQEDLRRLPDRYKALQDAPPFPVRLGPKAEQLRQTLLEIALQD